MDAKAPLGIVRGLDWHLWHCRDWVGPTCYHGVGRAPRWRLPGRYGTSFKSTRRLRRLATALRSLALAPLPGAPTPLGMIAHRTRNESGPNGLPM